MTVAQAGDVFAEKAMQLLVPALRLPGTDAVTSLLLLSQCEFGQNSESGHWVSVKCLDSDNLF